MEAVESFGKALREGRKDGKGRAAYEKIRGGLPAEDSERDCIVSSEKRTMY